MAKKKPSSDRHKGVPILIRGTPELKAALQRVADQERRSLARMGELLLEEILQQKGEFPHPPTKEP